MKSLIALGTARGKFVLGLTDHRMIKYQQWLNMEVKVQLHALSIVHSGDETPTPTGQKIRWQ